MVRMWVYIFQTRRGVWCLTHWRGVIGAIMHIWDVVAFVLSLGYAERASAVAAALVGLCDLWYLWEYDRCLNSTNVLSWVLG